MKLIPSDAEQKLGFQILRRRLEALAVSVPGRERVESMRPLGVRAAVERMLMQTAEIQQVIRVDDPLPSVDVPDVRHALKRAQPKDAVLEGVELAAILAVLVSHRRAYAYFRARRDSYASAAAEMLDVEPIEDLERHIVRVVDTRGQVREDASDELARIQRHLAETHAALDAALIRALREAARNGFAAEEQPTIRSGRAVIPIRAEAKRKVTGFVHDVSGTGQTVYIEPAAVLDLNNDVRELELERVREIRRLLQELTRHTRSRLAQVRAAADVLARLDELQARARLSNQLEALVPEINERGQVTIVRARNPALALHFMELELTGGGRGGSQSPRDVVPLDIELSDDVRTLIITGPNAGGKSVALTTTGLLCVMVACGLPVPAAPGTTLPLFENIFVDIGDQQSIEHDLSTFTSHLGNLRRMLAAADERSLVLIDEAGTGTDPAEGGALAEAVLEMLTRHGARTVVTTHHGTLKAFAHRMAHVENASMTFDRESLTPTYVVRAGVPGSSYAFEIAQRVGLPETVLRRARELLGEHKPALEDLIASLEERGQMLEARLREADDQRHAAERARQSLEERERALRERRQEILDGALEEAEQLVAEANARVERTIREIREAEAEREATRAARQRLATFHEQVAERRQEIRREVRSRQADRRQPTAPEHGAIGVGDQVCVDHEGATGEVLELGEGEAVVGLGQMRLRVRIDRLHKVGGPREQQVQFRTSGSAATGQLPALAAQRRIDLRGMRVDEALSEVERFIDQSVSSGLDSVEILHGKGTGALREAVRSYLTSRPEVSDIEDAAWNEGGHGVTVASL